MTRSAQWIHIHLTLPALPALLEFSSKELFSGFTCPVEEAFPYVTVLILIIAVSVFIREDLIRHGTADSDDSEDLALRLARDTMIGYLAVGIFLVTALTGLETITKIEAVKNLTFALMVCRATCVVVIISFVYHVFDLQGRYKLKVSRS